jgi:MFS family permease
LRNTDKQFGLSNTPKYPGVGYAYYVTFVLLFAYSVSYVDRQILSLMVEPIKADLHINDTQISLLQGFAFAIFYTLLGLFLGRVADRKNRRNLIIIGIVIWSFATAAGGLATGFSTLFLARIFVGVGESSLSPSAYSMLSDYFAPERRSRAISLYSLGVYLGSALAFIVGGLVSEAVRNNGSWKSVFFIVSIPGFIVALLMLTVREPTRQQEIVNGPVDIDYLKSRANIYVPLILGYSTISIVTLGLMAWVPAMFMRTWHWSARDIGVAFGSIILVCGLSGMMISGFLADYLVGKGRANGAFEVSFWGSVLLVPLTGCLAVSHTPITALTSLAAIMFALGFPVALAPSVYQTITPNRLRGQVIALYLLANNIIGMSIGPTAVAFVTNYILKDELRVGTSLSLVCVVASLIGVGLLAKARNVMRPERGSSEK